VEPVEAGRVKMDLADRTEFNSFASLATTAILSAKETALESTRWFCALQMVRAVETSTVMESIAQRSLLRVE
jgi:hypothetical protein